MIRCAICDDEVVFQDRVATGVHEYAHKNKIVFLVECFSSGEDLIRSSRLDYDVYFLDVNMKEINGMQVATKIREKNDKAVIVFVSGYVQYAARGYRVNAIRYLLKTKIDEEFEDCMDAVMEKIRSDDDELLEIRNGTKQILLKVSDILYIENFKRKVLFHMRGDSEKVYEQYAKITELAEELHSLGFIYCHSAYLVNAKKIAEIDQSEFVLSSGERIPISRQKYMQSQKEYYFYKTKSNVF